MTSLSKKSKIKQVRELILKMDEEKPIDFSKFSLEALHEMHDNMERNNKKLVLSQLSKKTRKEMNEIESLKGKTQDFFN